MAKAPFQLPKKLVEDNFNWQEEIIKSIKKYQQQ
jgi:hypothetical protein